MHRIEIEREIVKTLRHIYTYYEIRADPKDATVIGYIKQLINNVGD